MQVPCRAGTSIDVCALSQSSSRSAKVAILRKLEHALRTDGWVRIEPVPEAVKSTTAAAYNAAGSLFNQRATCERHKRDVLFAQGGENLALSFLDLGEEPLYDAQATSQRVRSFNIHSIKTAAELDSALPDNYDADERKLAHAYHSAAPCAATAPLLDAATALREALTSTVCIPVCGALALLLGLDERELANRCQGTRSDNTSLLRCLEYPKTVEAARCDTMDHEMGTVWGVSEHTDFERKQHAQPRVHLQLG
jgi:isopenicillin N synthase-like dioxygenase